MTHRPPATADAAGRPSPAAGTDPGTDPGDTAQAQPVLETQGVSRRFGGFQALNGVSLRVRAGHIHALIGPNGAGKSTLFNVITGALKPSAGRVFVKGREVTALPPHRVARSGLARNFQITQVFSTLTVEENLSLALERGTHRHSRKADGTRPDRLRQALDQAHLGDRGRALAGVLAHGERKRLELAMTLATGAEVLLLDEPTSGMSVEERAEMATLLTEISRQATVLITEHDFDFIKSVSDVVTALADGQIIAEGSSAAIEENAEVRARYLGEPDA